MKNHQLYTSKDFKNWSGEAMENNKLVEMVIDGGLDVCKLCGEFEAGLDQSCKSHSENIDTITVRWQYEYQLEMDMTTEMFRASDVIDGVRMYPFIITDDGKFYLEVKS